MTADAAISFTAPWGALAGVILLLGAMIVVWTRGLQLARGVAVLGAVGGLLLACAAGRPEWNRPSEKWVAVMVDVSASTRGAVYRDRGALQRRVAELLGKIPYRVSYFADGLVDTPSAMSGEVLEDAPGEKTVFPAPPGAAAVLLFSDCRFDLPRYVAPTYVVVDPGLEDVDDARVTSLQVRGNEVAAAISNGRKTRSVSWHGTSGASTGLVQGGSMVVSKSIAAGATKVGVELAAGDLWPENDRLSATVPPPEKLERWWVGKGTAPPGWRGMLAGDLPGEMGAYLGAGVVVLHDVEAGALSEAQQQGLARYVQNAGGGVVILGGEHAFGAGGYAGTALDGISPLASRPPEPTVHWVVLVDQSGSMGSQVDNGGNRWDYAARAVKAVVTGLPPDDLASVGGFAEGVDWWALGRRAKELAATPLPPGNAYPHGPTNLEAALQAVAHVAGAMTVQVLVISDFDAKIENADGLVDAFKTKGAHVHALAIGEGSALGKMKEIASATGGTSVTQLDPAKWAIAARQMLRARFPDLVRRERVRVTYAGSLGNVPDEVVSTWNRTWTKQGATMVADATDKSAAVPMGASWNLGEGRVMAAAFEPGAGAVEAMARLAERKPRDPSFRVTWEAGAKVRLAVDAVEAGKFLNDLKATMELAEDGVRGGAAEVVTLTQTAPGRYEAEVAAPRSSRLVTVRVGERVVERFVVAGRYAPEFETVGNDHVAMEELGRRSGGRVIGSGEQQAIRIDWPRERVALGSEVGLVGVGCLLGALWWWRRT